MTPPKLLDLEINPKFFEQHFERYLLVEGAKCAGWLVGTNRMPLLRYGTFHINVPLIHEGKPYTEPPWFRLAIAKLRQRPKFWKIARVRKKTGGYALGSNRTEYIVYEIHWKRWMGTRSVGNA